VDRWLLRKVFALQCTEDHGVVAQTKDGASQGPQGITKRRRYLSEAGHWLGLTDSHKDIYHFSPSNVIASGDGAIGDAPYDLEDDAEENTNFIHERSSLGNSNDISMFVRKILEFTTSGFVSITLTIDGFREMLDLLDPGAPVLKNMTQTKYSPRFNRCL
jgi:hypothetical protein